MSTGPRRLGKYELREFLGRGGMAEVWKAFDTHLQRFVAIKIMHADLQNDPDFMKRFEREARVVASMHHRNIVQIHDFQVIRPPETESTIAYMVMEYVQGQTLTDYIHSTSHQGKFPSAAEILHLFGPISTAIDYAHQHGMIHRDIKPGNILLDQRSSSLYRMGEPILTDFGIVKLLGSSTGTLSGWWMGTPAYISPEQAQGHRGTERSDIYSLGVILYEICTGVRPFQGDTPISIMMQHISTRPTSPDLINPKISPALTAVILRVLAKDPAERFSSASSLTAALAEAFNLPISGNPQPVHLLDVMSEPTYTAPPQRGGPLTPSSPVLPDAASSTPTYFAAPPTPNFAVSTGNGRITTTTPISTTITSLPTELTPPTKPMRKSRWSSRVILSIAIVLLLLLVGSGLGTFYVLSHQQSAPAVTANSIVGHASFLSSGQFQEGSNQGFNDELEINLQNIPALEPDKSYYAWLLADKFCSTEPDNPNTVCDPNDPKHERILKPIAPIFLGKLPFDNGTIHFIYLGDPQNSNLIGLASRFLITAENASRTPTSPSTDQRTWRYYAELPQIRSDTDAQTRAIDILRRLLSGSPDLDQLGLQGGLDIHFFMTTQQVLQLANSARNAWQSKDIVTAQNQIIRILDYLDGQTLVGRSRVQGDVPCNLPQLVGAKIAFIPLDNLVINQDNASYVDRISNQLGGLDNQIGITIIMRQLGRQINDALINNVKVWLEQAHQDVKQLACMSSTQLQQSSTLTILNDIVAQLGYAFNGRIDPSSGKLQEGVKELHNDMQQLATFDVRPYSQ